MRVFLTEDEMRIATWVGKMRSFNGTSKGYTPYNQDQATNESEHVQGASAEMASCKALNRYWNITTKRIDSIDIPPDAQVRSTIHQNGHLLLRDKDPDQHRYILVIPRGENAAKETIFDLIGWISGAAGKQKEYWRDPTGKNRFAFFVPQAKLNDMEMF